MSGARIEGSARKVQMKTVLRGFFPETWISSRWRKVGDANLEQLDSVKLKRRVFDTQNQIPSTLASNMVKNVIYHVAGFLPAVLCNKLMVECARHYDPQTRTILAPSGVVLAFLSEEAIRKTFGIPHYDGMLNRTKQESSTLFEKAPGRCMGLATSDWMSGPKRP